MLAGSFVFTVVCAAVMLGALAANKLMLMAVAKMLASCGFLAMAIAGGALQYPYGWAVLAGLFFSWWGDLFLLSYQDKIFLAGLVVFFLAHVAYVGAFAVHGVNWPTVAAAAMAMVVPFALVAWWLRGHLGEMRVPVYAYMLVISLMVAFSAGAWAAGGTRWIPVAAVLFYVSDIFVARDKFVRPGIVNRYLGLPLYYGGQVVFAYTVAATFARMTQ